MKEQNLDTIPDKLQFTERKLLTFLLCFFTCASLWLRLLKLLELLGASLLLLEVKERDKLSEHCEEDTMLSYNITKNIKSVQRVYKNRRLSPINLVSSDFWCQTVILFFISFLSHRSENNFKAPQKQPLNKCRKTSTFEYTSL